ncbi:MAG TPA: hypothetical protein VJ453_06855 [Terriglobales bacterium]|nr:hypothetical protein [Terriglobales bacterium]
MKHIALATSEAYKSLTADDQLLLAPLAMHGIQAAPAIWSDEKFPWASMDAVVLRSCWDYHLRLPEFLRWLSRMEDQKLRVWNPPALMRWNADKIYLRDLEAKGVAVIPTIWPDAAIRLDETMGNLGWEQAIVKPRVSATAHKTCLTSASDTVLAQPILDELVAGPGALVQKFMPEIQAEGEWSLVFFAGRFSHAVVKTPKPGDFRVQHDFGGLERSAEPPVYVLEDATQVMKAVGEPTLYARVDGVESAGRLYLMELELIEPALFLNSMPSAPDRFAKTIASLL